MATILRNRGDLKRQVLRLLDASEDEEFQSRIDYWVDLGIQDVMSAMRAAWAVRAAIATVDSDGVIQLPPSYLGMVTVYPLTGGKPLNVIAPDQAGEWFARVGPPYGYMIEGLLMTLLPLQTAPFQARYTYYSELEPLIEDSHINMYLTKANSALLYASASHGAVYRGDSGLASQFANMATARIDSVNEETQSALFGSGFTVQRQR